MSLKNLPKPQKSGILLIDKPADFSSHDMIAIVRRVLRTKTIGHSGTLDPMATGLLILLVGREAANPNFYNFPKPTKLPSNWAKKPTRGTVTETL